jgi:hypothetical protein
MKPREFMEFSSAVDIHVLTCISGAWGEQRRRLKNQAIKTYE